jgi:hypothetical protein
MKVWLLSGGGFKGAVQLATMRALRQGGLPDAIYGVSVGSINGALAAQDDLDVAERIWGELDDGSPIDGIRGFLSPAVHRWRGILSLGPMRRQANKLIAVPKLQTRYGCGIVIRDPAPEQAPYVQPEFGRGAHPEASGGLAIQEAIEASSAVAGVMEPVDTTWAGRPALLADGGHQHVFPVLPSGTPLDGLEVHAIGCSAIAGPVRRRDQVDGLLDAVVWAMERAMHAAYLGDIARLHAYARGGARVSLYLPYRSTGGMLQADRATIEDRLAMGEWMASHPEQLAA